MMIRLVLAALVALAPAIAHAAPRGFELRRIDNVSPDADDAFGQAVALAGADVVIGAPLDDTLAPDGGIVHVVAPGGSVTQLAPSAPQADGRWGAALEVEGEWLFVGAPKWNGSGAVAVFRAGPSGWSESEVLEMPAAGPGAWFGQAMSASGDLLVVGAPFASTGSEWPGLAYAFELVEGKWAFAGELGVAGARSASLLGASVAAGDGIAVIGGPYLGNQFVEGSAHVFVRDAGGWHWQQELAGSLQQGRDRHGASCAIDGTDVLVGSPRDTPPATGVVTTFAEGHGPRRGTWSETEAFVSPEATPFDRFGASLALDGRRLVVGAPTADGVGEVHVLGRHGRTWAPVTSVAAPDGGPLELFGADVDAAAGRVLIGAPGHAGTGAVYVLEESRRLAL